MQCRSEYLERQEAIEAEFNEKLNQCLMGIAEHMDKLYEVSMGVCS